MSDVGFSWNIFGLLHHSTSLAVMFRSVLIPHLISLDFLMTKVILLDKIKDKQLQNLTLWEKSQD